MPLPDRIKNKPVLCPGLDFYYAAFWDLVGDRAGGLSEGLITWCAIIAYGRTYGIHDPDELDRLVSLVRRMDMVYLNHQQKKTKPKITPVNGKGKDTRVRRIGP
jgi:hypothetical protein